MIILNLTGGLGNQMFQYAFGRYLTIKNKTEFKYHFTNALLNTSRQFELNVFNIKTKPATNEDLKELGINSNWIINRFLYIVEQRIKIKLRKKVYTETKSGKFDPSFFNIPNNSYVQGYWQDERYFKDIKDVISKDFTFKKKIDNKNKKILKLIKKTSSVSIHIRRGDYVTNKTGPKFIGLDYYQKKIANIEKKVVNPVFFVFSDDIQWCKKNLESKYKMYFVSGNNDMNAWKDMLLMSQCKQNIVANSSFSWWAKWLNKNSIK